MKYGAVVRLSEELVRFSHLPTHAVYGIIMDELGIPGDERKYIDISVQQDFMSDTVLFKFRTETPGILPSIQEGMPYSVMSINIDSLSKYRWDSGTSSCAA